MIEAGRLVRVDPNPLQIPGKHRLVNIIEYCGPHCGLDTRLYIGASTLERLLEVAKASLIQTVVLDQIGIVAKTWHDERSGHTYETWEWICRPPHALTLDLTSAAPVLGGALPWGEEQRIKGGGR